MLVIDFCPFGMILQNPMPLQHDLPAQVPKLRVLVCVDLNSLRQQPSDRNRKWTALLHKLWSGTLTKLLQQRLVMKECARHLALAWGQWTVAVCGSIHTDFPS